MYGSTAPGLCKVFKDGLTTAEQNDLLGNPSGRRPKSTTTDSVTYGRLVVNGVLPTAAGGLQRGRQGPRPVDLGALSDGFHRQAIVRTRAERQARIRIAWPALGMLMVASVGSIAQLSDSATFGWGAVTVCLIPAAMFLSPVGLVSAEPATSNRGGIFVWVRDAYGDRSGFQATWFVFMNSVTLYPALLSFGAA